MAEQGVDPENIMSQVDRAASAFGLSEDERLAVATVMLQQGEARRCGVEEFVRPDEWRDNRGRPIKALRGYKDFAVEYILEKGPQAFLALTAEDLCRLVISERP